MKVKELDTFINQLLTLSASILMETHTLVSNLDEDQFQEIDNNILIAFDEIDDAFKNIRTQCKLVLEKNK